MDFSIGKTGQYTLIKVLKNKLDSHNSPALKSELVILFEKGEKNIIMDLSNCKYCDSAGLSAILVGNRLCNKAGGSMVLTGLTPEFERLITISQLDTVLMICKNINDAVKIIESK